MKPMSWTDRTSIGEYISERDKDRDIESGTEGVCKEKRGRVCVGRDAKDARHIRRGWMCVRACEVNLV